MNASTSSFTLWLKQNIFRLSFFIMTTVFALIFTLEQICYLVDSFPYSDLKFSLIVFCIATIIFAFIPPIIALIRMLPKNQEPYLGYSTTEIIIKLCIGMVFFLIYTVAIVIALIANIL